MRYSKTIDAAYFRGIASSPTTNPLLGVARPPRLWGEKPALCRFFHFWGKTICVRCELRSTSPMILAFEKPA